MSDGQISRDVASDNTAPHRTFTPLGRRNLLRGTGMLVGASSAGLTMAAAQPSMPAARSGGAQSGAGTAARDTALAHSGKLHKRMLGYMLGHEQFSVPDLVQPGRRWPRAPASTCWRPATTFSPGRRTRAMPAGVGDHGRAGRAGAAELDGHHGHLPHAALQPRRRCGSVRLAESAVSRPHLPRCRVGRGAERARGDRRMAEMAGALGSPDRGASRSSARCGAASPCRTRASFTPSRRNSTIRRRSRSRS